MPADRSTLTSQMIQDFTWATLESRHDPETGKSPLFLDSQDTPSFDMFRRDAKPDVPVRGEYVETVMNRRGQGWQSYSGFDRLGFEYHETGDKLRYRSGSWHYGAKIPLQVLRHAGLNITQGNAGMPNIKLDPGLYEVMTDLWSKKLTQMEEDIRYLYAKHFWISNSADPKMWVGMDGLLPTTSATLGTIGGRPRSTPGLSHNLRTSVAVADLEDNIGKLVRDCRRSNRQSGASDYVIVAGEAVIDALRALNLGTASVTTKLTRTVNDDRINLMTKQIGVTLPDDVFYIPGINAPIIMDPFFDVLEQDTGDAWTKRMYVLPKRFVQFKPTRNLYAEYIVHPIPADQETLFISYRGEASICCSKPNACGVLTIA